MASRKYVVFASLALNVAIFWIISAFQMFKFVAEVFLSRFRSTAGLATVAPCFQFVPMGVCLLDDNSTVCPSLWDRRIFYIFVRSHVASRNMGCFRVVYTEHFVPLQFLKYTTAFSSYREVWEHRQSWLVF